MKPVLAALARVTSPTFPVGSTPKLRGSWVAPIAVVIASVCACSSKSGGGAPAVPDATTAVLDATTPTRPVPDAMTPGRDAMMPGPDAMTPGRDAMMPVPDAMTPVPDAMTQGRDATTPVPDAAVDAAASAPCESASLKWRTARKTNYTSYPAPDSEECVKYNGCMWAGQFAACAGKQTEQWVAEHHIVAAFPDFATLKLHDLCLRARGKTIVVTVYDTCADSDCDGCCTENQRDADQLIDVEHYTDARWGVADGPIEWADLGPTKTAGCN